MVYTGQPSKGCATCRKRRVKCDEQSPQCSGCLRINQQCPGYKNHFDLAWRDQTAVAKKGVERGKAKRKAAREREQSGSKRDSLPLHAPVAQYSQSSGSSSRTSASPNFTFTPPPSNHGSQRSSISSHHEDEDTSEIIIQYSSGPPLNTDPYLTLLRPIPEEQALCFFFNNFVLPIRDPLARRGFLEHLGPFYANSGSKSALTMSTMAVATCMMSVGMGRPPDSALARSFYLRAVCRLQERVSQQDNCSSDELIIAVMLLQFYEASVGYLTKSTSTPHPHLDGALALIRHRGPRSFQTPVSRSILFYIRGLLIDEAFRSVSPLPRDVLDWEEIMPESEKLPGIRLDSINLDLANLRATAFSAINGPQTKYRDPLLQKLVQQATEIDKRLYKWPDSLPESWLPHRLSGKDHIYPTLQLYQDYCDVYKTLFIAGLWNKLRLSQIELRFTIISLLNNQPYSLANHKRQEGCQNGIQELADDICASVPYFIGDRIKAGRGGEPGIHYPQIPGQPPIIDHYKSGPALGGWSLLAPLVTLMKMKIRLRDGQRDWIAGQMARTARIYNIGLSSMKKG